MIPLPRPDRTTRLQPVLIVEILSGEGHEGGVELAFAQYNDEARMRAWFCCWASSCSFPDLYSRFSSLNVEFAFWQPLPQR